MRQAKIERKTKETWIQVELDLDGRGTAGMTTGIAFLDHMLTLLARHARIDLKVTARGDLDVDDHHTVEDTGIVIGQAINMALSDKRGICRYGDARVPMDEALADAALDLSGRSYLVFSARFDSAQVGAFSTQMVEEFFRAVAYNAGITLHLSCPYGRNDHHKIEALFKAFARSLRQAVAVDPQAADEVPSTKGTL
jgi:imidazoleglycerol-phosphate dehydratase